MRLRGTKEVDLSYQQMLAFESKNVSGNYSYRKAE